MVVLVILLTTFVVAIAYWIGVPYWWNNNKIFTVFLIIFGNWLLINVIFHYYMGVTTPPGFPTSVYNVFFFLIANSLIRILIVY